MDNESKETRRPWFLIVGGLISIVCSFTSLESAYSQNSPNRHSPPPQTYWFFPGDTPNYFHGVYGQFGSFAGLIGPAVNTGFNTTVDLMHGALEVTDAYVFGGHLGARIVPASDFSPLMAQYDRMVKCEGQEVADQTYTTSNVINGLVTEAVGAAQHSLTVDGSTALMDWWANFSGGTLGGAIATAPIGALPWGRPLSPAVRPPPIRRPPIVVVPVTEVFINGKWVPVGGSAPTTALLPRPVPAPPNLPPLLRPPRPVRQPFRDPGREFRTILDGEHGMQTIQSLLGNSPTTADIVAMTELLAEGHGWTLSGRDSARVFGLIDITHGSYEVQFARVPDCRNFKRHMRLAMDLEQSITVGVPTPRLWKGQHPWHSFIISDEVAADLLFRFPWIKQPPQVFRKPPGTR